MPKSKLSQGIEALKSVGQINGTNGDDIARLSFYGATHMVSGSNYLLEAKGRKILVDCGIFHGVGEMAEKNHEPFLYNPKEIDFLLVTHAHFDHIGRIPKLFKDGFGGKIYATPPTIDMARLMFKDSQRLVAEGTVKDGVEFFEESAIEKIMALFSPVNYDEKLELDKDIVCFFRDAGHVLGSSMIEVWLRKKPHQGEFTKIAFSGDIGNPNIAFALLNPPSYLKNVDYVVMESTYGDRNHEITMDAKDLLEDIIENTVASQGVLMIPISAMERTQQVLYHLNELAENKRIPYVPIYVDSPLAINLTKIYQKYADYLNDKVRAFIAAGESIFRFPGLSYTASVSESKMINRVPPPKIIMAGSGMSTGGRIMHHEMRYLSDPNSTLLVVSYQAYGTPGRHIQEGAKEVRLGDEMVAVKARIEIIAHYSDHIDQAELLKWVANFKHSVKKIFITHGEEKSSRTLQQVIMDNLGLRPEMPKFGETFEIDITK